MSPLHHRTKRAFQRVIWDFYAGHGRDFPWRQAHDPYHILVSEFMLQQTQVSRVVEKYTAFIKQFPTPRALARAPQSEVLIAWQGLGYNRRAKHLHAAAHAISDMHAGAVPQSKEELLKLPGVGQSTAGAVRAFAFNQPEVFIETNIRRVYIHHFFADHGNVTDAELAPIIEQTIDTANPRGWYWALMDYGSHLPKITPNPNTKSRHYTKQPAFKGSNREVRGAILRLLATKNATQSTMVKELGFEKDRILRALTQLRDEKFIQKQKHTYTLAE